MAFDDVYADVTTISDNLGYYDAVNDDYARVLYHHRPPGIAWRFEDTSDFYQLLRGMSYAFYRVAQRVQDLIEEIDPRTTFELLPDWERLLGLPGNNPSPPTTLSARRAAVHARLLGFGDPTAAYYIEVALALGYVATITSGSYEPFIAGSGAGEALYNNTYGGWAYTWILTTASGADDALLEWTIRRLAPIHTTVIFDYV